MSRYIIIIFLIISDSLSLSCSNDNNKLNSDHVDIKKAFQTDQEKFVDVVKILTKTPNLNTIVRRSVNKIPEMKKYSKSMDYFYSYLIRIGNKDMEINIPQEYSDNEYLFWEQDFSKIKGRYSSEYLGSFLKNNISENEFKELINFLSKYNLFSIFRRPNEEIIYIEEEYYKGIYYDTETTDVKPDLSPNAKIKKLEDHWYYYDDNRDLER